MDGKVILFFSHSFPADFSKPYSCVDPETVPSLIALLAADPEITVLALPEKAPWSKAHILSAAKQLKNRGGRVFLLGPPPAEKLPLLSYAGTAKELERELLAIRHTETENTVAKPRRPFSSPPNKEDTVAWLMDRPILPIRIPGDVVFHLAVAGSQARIGCTTQALGLWHWCKALGFDPAIVAEPDWIDDIARLMGGGEALTGGAVIEGIPFVTDEGHAYDCYIQDLGVLGAGNRERFCGTDWSVLVAGVKLWELAATASAVAGIRSRAYASILLSFATSRDEAEMGGLFEGRKAAAAPWLPRPWNPTAGLLRPYDTLLRPVLLRYLQDRAYSRERSL